MKKSFTLLELVISITIFMIVLIFMYKVLDDTKNNDKKFNSYLNKELKINSLNKLFIEDVGEKISDLEVSIDKNGNDIVSFKSKNTFYSPYFNNIIYLLIEKSFLRVESFNKIDLKVFSYESLDNSFIDVIADNITKFRVIKNENKTVFVFDLKNNKKQFFTVYNME